MWCKRSWLQRTGACEVVQLRVGAVEAQVASEVPYEVTSDRALHQSTSYNLPHEPQLVHLGTSRCSPSLHPNTYYAAGSSFDMAAMPNPRSFRLNFAGDVMLGRLVDQLFHEHVHEPSEAAALSSFLHSHPQLRNYSFEHPWGNTLPLWKSGDLNLINLETAATTHPEPWPAKVFNYRMHPTNIQALHAANIDYAGLANNHTLDFCREGLVETVRTLKDASIAFAGAGESADEARRPAILPLPGASHSEETGAASHQIHVYSASDHPSDWSKEPGFNLINFSASTRARLKADLTKSTTPKPSLKIFSVHWGPNYSWNPDDSICSLAHFLIDECGVDIIHGHSSHHIQGVEKYKGKLIIYGCGDFVDDYAVNPGYRNDLSAVWRVTVKENGGNNNDSIYNELTLKTLEIFPTRIKLFQAHRLDPSDADHQWVKSKLQDLCHDFGTSLSSQLGDQGQLVLEI